MAVATLAFLTFQSLKAKWSAVPFGLPTTPATPTGSYAHAGGTLDWTVECNGPCVAFIISQACASRFLFAGDSAGATCGSAVASGEAADTYGMFVAIGGAGGSAIFTGYLRQWL